MTRYGGSATLTPIDEDFIRRVLFVTVLVRDLVMSRAHAGVGGICVSVNGQHD